MQAVLGLTLLLGAISCDRAGTVPPPRGMVAAPAPTAPDTACGETDVRPATAAPAEGVWLYDGEGQHRVAAIVGPAQAVAGHAQVTRRVETLEARPGADTIRYASDTATVRLQFLTPAGRPAAVYPVGPGVLLAAYEPCTPGSRNPLIRYVREDESGGVATDVMLQRDHDPMTSTRTAGPSFR
jgi:hypothetical protein